MNKIYSSIIALLFALNFYGQQPTKGNASISGKIIEQSTEQSLAFASVVLQNEEKKLIQGIISDEQGEYSFVNIPVGNFTVMVSYTGFNTYNKVVKIENNSQKIDLETIRLEQDASQLSEVVIVGEKSQVSLKLDKKVFRVGRDVLSQSSSVSEVLENVPSVTVDPSGTVMLRGNANVTILINGRRSAMTSSEALEQISSDNVDRVEVITTPSARYDATGSAGIINIILKKNTKDGFTGQVTATVGSPADSRGTGSLSYRTDKINIFGTIGIRYNDYEGDYTRKQTSW
ncbi:MAG: TonB-dependent receptor [Flavobacteriaceae bacterium]|nr:TonB-dependent receptor [Flavobacteriaceae bacterium]